MNQDHQVLALMALSQILTGVGLFAVVMFISYRSSRARAAAQEEEEDHEDDGTS